MSHVSEDRICLLAQNIVRELPFTPEDVADLEHIETCDLCYEELMCTTALAKAMGDDIVSLSNEVETEEQNTAVIKLVVFDMQALMDQLLEHKTSWFFDAPMHTAKVRSGAKDSNDFLLLRDQDNSLNFVSYDPAEKRLVIQMEWNEGQLPKAYLEQSDGTRREITFEKFEHILRAQVENVENGEYRIVITR